MTDNKKREQNIGESVAENECAETMSSCMDTEAAAECEKCSCGERHKKRTPEEQKALISRLRRVEGQIRGIEKMLENDAYCPDILIQVSAATSALNSFSKVLLSSHIHTCVAEDIRDGKDEVIDELCHLLQKMMK